MSNFFDKEKYVFNYENLQAYSRIGLKLKKIYRVLECNQWQWLKKTYIEFNTQKRGEAEKMETKMEKRCTSSWITLYTEKQWKNLKNKIDVKLVKNEKDYLKCTLKPS